MRILHLSDLHIGKRVNEFSMIEDQEYILLKIINIIDEQNIDIVIIAGDIYDKSVPTSDSVTIFDDFLTRLAQRAIKVFVISGNHDSAQRIAFGSRLMNISGVYMSPVFDGMIKPITVEDEYGEINIYMIPFIKPVYVKNFFPDAQINSYNDAMKVIIDNLNIDNQKRNILITHQFITGAITSESEDISVGGIDNIDARLFDDFDYVALGHIHRPQHIHREAVRYSGTPLKYSFSEANDKKSATIVAMGKKGNISIDAMALIPKRDMREIKGTYEEIVSSETYLSKSSDDYMHITLTDEDDITDAIGKLRAIYPNIMKIDYDNKRTRTNNIIDINDGVETKTPLELFQEFYLLQNNTPMTDIQSILSQKIIEDIWGEQI